VLGQVGLIVLIDRIQTPSGARTAAWLLARAQLDGAGIFAGILVAYFGFVGFIGGQGVRQVRLATEMKLAREIHDSLAPPIAMRGRRFEAYGRSVPSSEAGGDLADLVPFETGMVALVADVFGHGVGAGTHVPLGVRASERYPSRTLDALPGDLFVLLSDGVVEIEDRAGRQLGLDAIERTVIACATAPLETIYEAVMDQVRGHGKQVDDVTVLLARKH
jgi:serine phosphatase RsbU (regulator of sigma subunit)